MLQGWGGCVTPARALLYPGLENPAVSVAPRGIRAPDGAAAAAERIAPMTEFILVLATAAGMITAPVAAPPAPGATAAVTAAPGPARSFRTYADAGSCEQAAEALKPPPGMRLLCLPVESSTLVETAF
jgi:hypothetical protein